MCFSKLGSFGTMRDHGRIVGSSISFPQDLDKGAPIPFPKIELWDAINFNKRTNM